MQNGKKHFFDDPGNVRKFIGVFFTICGLLLVADFFIPKHGEYFWEDVPQFYAAFGLVACVTLVIVAKHVLRRLVKRKEDYYD